MSPLLAAKIVDWSAILQVVVVSVVVGVGLTAVFSIAVFGAVRSVDSARDGRGLSAATFGALALLALAACLAAIFYGIALMAAK